METANHGREKDTQAHKTRREQRKTRTNKRHGSREGRVGLPFFSHLQQVFPIEDPSNLRGNRHALTVLRTLKAVETQCTLNCAGHAMLRENEEGNKEEVEEDMERGRKKRGRGQGKE